MSKKNKPKYKDANNAEEVLLEVFTSKDPSSIIKDLDQWEYRYHLDPARQNIISWFDFKKNSHILEVGAGCGAITPALSNLADKVTAIEPMKDRYKVLKARCKSEKYTNVETLNLDTTQIAKTGSKFDYVVCVGVLEYAGKFIDSKEPHQEFVNQLTSLTKKGGQILLAIENKYGLKYWAGHPEDHVNRAFENIENYPNQWVEGYKGVKTFSRGELEVMLKKSGCKEVEFYYPLPDYKFPKEIFSDDYHPGPHHPIHPSSLTDSGLAHHRVLFDQKRTLDGLVSNDMFKFFANSFLVVASI
jgi:2-polyprenyl-3-methyl-5-hydroxy-6-metoxy-1,4-benzoquinol methylase